MFIAIIGAFLIASCALDINVDGETEVKHTITFDLTTINEHYEDFCSLKYENEEEINQCIEENMENFLTLIQNLAKGSK